jgi:hypothetical protein
MKLNLKKKLIERFNIYWFFQIIKITSNNIQTKKKYLLNYFATILKVQKNYNQIIYILMLKIRFVNKMLLNTNYQFILIM